MLPLYFHYNMRLLYMLALLALSYRYYLLLYYMFIYFMLYPVRRTSLFNLIMLQTLRYLLPNYSIMSNYIYPDLFPLLLLLMLHFHLLVSLDSALLYMLDLYYLLSHLVLILYLHYYFMPYLLLHSLHLSLLMLHFMLLILIPIYIHLLLHLYSAMLMSSYLVLHSFLIP